MKVFAIAACVCAFGGIFYTIFVSGDEQPWNKHESDKDFKSAEEVTLTNNMPLYCSISSLKFIISLLLMEKHLNINI